MTKKFYSVEVCESSNNWFNFKADSLAAAKAKLKEIKEALRKIKVLLVNENDVDVFKETSIKSVYRSFNVRAECPFCGDWFWQDLSEERLCWVECPACDEHFMLFTLEDLKALGFSCNTCPDTIDCLSVPTATK